MMALLVACGEGEGDVGSGSSQVNRGVRFGADESGRPAGALVGEDGQQLGGSQKPSSPTDPSPATPPEQEPGRPDTDAPLGKEPSAPTKKTLNLIFERQSTGYWCGPSATRMVISGRESSPPSQATLAAQLGTDEDGTDHIGLMVDLLNARWKLSGAAAYVRRDISDPPTAQQRAQLKKDLVARISAGYGIVANVVSGWRPPTYPPGTWYHYVAVVGYDDNGDKALIADPASGGGAFTAVPQTYWISTYDLGTWVSTKGYTGGP